MPESSTNTLGYTFDTEALHPRIGYSPFPGSGEKYFSYLSGTPFHASASGGGVPLRVMLGHFTEKSAFILSHFSALPSESGRIAAGGHSGSHTPQSMHSSGWMTSMLSPS